jgi:polyisoprenoid-binding protein YceI
MNTAEITTRSREIIVNALTGAASASLVVLWLMAAGLALAAPAAVAETWQLAPGPSSVEFTVRHLLFTARGSFGDFEGQVTTLGEDFDGARVEATVNVASVYTGHKDRDRELLSKTFFWIARHPAMTFRSTQVMKRDDATYSIVGELTLRGVTRPIELAATFGGKRRISGGRERADFVATATLNRFDYALKWNERLDTGQALLSNTVEITLTIVLMRQAEGGRR